MTPEELMQALKSLDSLYMQRDSFKSWLSGSTEASDDYEQVKQQIESMFPGLHVVYVDVTYKQTHALIAGD